MSSLRVDGLEVQRAGRTVLRDVSLEVRPGEITALLGANGAGKSSTVMAIAGILPFRQGRIELGDRSIGGLRPEQVRRRGVSVVLEGHRILGDLTVEENLRTAALAGGARKARSAVEGVLDTFPELREHLDRPSRTLSGGQQQMVALAQGLTLRPRILVVDELSLGLAPVVVRRLAAALRDVASTGTGVLLIEQFTSLALNLANQVYVLRTGRIVLSETSGALRERPERLTQAYLGTEGADAAPARTPAGLDLA